MNLRRVLFMLGVASAAASCSLIYSVDGFDKQRADTGGVGGDAAVTFDAPDTDGPISVEAGPIGPCAGMPDGTMCGPAMDACHSVNVCAAGACVEGKALPDGTTCPAKDVCHAWACAAGACAQGNALPDGTAHDSSKHTACCGGTVVSLTTVQNCNACGLTCGSPLTCQPQGTNPTIYQCMGCMTYGANLCFTPNHCCVTSLVAQGVCAASDCNGGCTSSCPNGSHCIGVSMHPADVDNYCSY
jgi:hypothetical protein